MFLRQGITVTGLSAPGFNNIISNFQRTYDFIAACLPADAMTKWQLATYEGHQAIDCHARYFTTRRASPHEANMDFGPGVDPEGVLARLRGQDLIHGGDNKVAYLKRSEEEGQVR